MSKDVAAKRQHAAVSLEDFMRARAVKDCLICALPVEVRRQLGNPARDRGFSRADQVRWLREAVGAHGVSLEILHKHLSARHDREEELAR